METNAENQHPSTIREFDLNTSIWEEMDVIEDDVNTGKGNNDGVFVNNVEVHCEINHMENECNGVDDILVYEKPSIGMVFESEDDAYQYYNIYARAKGFSVRKGSTRRSQKTENKENDQIRLASLHEKSDNIQDSYNILNSSVRVDSYARSVQADSYARSVQADSYVGSARAGSYTNSATNGVSRLSGYQFNDQDKMLLGYRDPLRTIVSNSNVEAIWPRRQYCTTSMSNFQHSTQGQTSRRNEQPLEQLGLNLNMYN